MIQFYDKTFLIVDNEAIVTQEKISVDYLIIHNSPRLQIEDLLSSFDCQQIIVDGSNQYWQVEKWKQEGEGLNIAIHDARNDEAFVLTF